jgi:hypothetical protein
MRCSSLRTLSLFRISPSISGVLTASPLMSSIFRVSWSSAPICLQAPTNAADWRRNYYAGSNPLESYDKFGQSGFSQFALMSYRRPPLSFTLG